MNSYQDTAGYYLRDYEWEYYSFLERNLFFWDAIQSIFVPPDAEEFYDVSFYQRGMNWDIYSANARAVILRIGQNVWKDPEFETFYAQAKNRNLAVGGYFFFDGRVSPQQQANVIISAMQGKSFEMELFIDWERSYNGLYEGLPNVVKLMQLCEAAGIRCKGIGIYTGYYWFINNTNAISHSSLFNYLKDKPLWLAWYASASVVKIPAPFLNWTHWQTGTPVKNVGQPTAEIDHNKHNGTKAQFGERYLGGEPVPPPSGDDMAKYEVIGTQGLNLRTGPSTSFGIIRLVPTKSYVWGTLESTGWIKGVKFQEPGKSEVTQNFYCSGATTLVKEVVEPVPVPSKHVVEVFVDGVSVYRQELD